MSSSGVPRALLRDSEAEARLSERGVTAIPLLDPDDVEALRALYQRLHPRAGLGFDTDFAYLAPDHKREVARGIREVVAPRLADVLHPFRVFNLTFVVKWPGGGSELPVHCDWAYVDERRHRCATVWVPLGDTSPHSRNGPLGVLPRSHRLPQVPRGANSVPWYAGYREQLGSHLEFQSVGAGDALLFDCRILHGSAATESDLPRIAVAAMVTGAEVPLRYHHQADDTWEVFEIDDDFFVRHGPIDLRARPILDAAVVERLPLQPVEAPLAELHELCSISLGPPHEGDPPPMAGEPLGLPTPTPIGGVAGLIGRARFRVIAPQRRSPIQDPPPLGHLRGATQQLRRDWQDLGHLASELPVRDLPTTGGWWSSRRLPPDGGAPASTLIGPLTGAARVSGAWLVQAGPRSELQPHRRPVDASLLAVLPLSRSHPPGTVVLQVGDEVRPLDDAPVAFDPSWPHSAVNLSGETVSFLVVEIPRRLPLPRRAVDSLFRLLQSTVAADAAVP
jgi:hypothetical protein